MEILGIGPLELIFILLIAFIIIGPGDMAKTGRTIGRFLRNVVTSQWWMNMRKASHELRRLPYTLMREANLEDAAQEIEAIKSIGGDINSISNILEQSDFVGWVNPDPQSGDPAMINQATENPSRPNPSHPLQSD